MKTKFLSDPSLIGVSAIFVINAKFLSKRKLVAEKRLEEIGISKEDINWIHAFDHDEITDEILNCFWPNGIPHDTSLSLKLWFSYNLIQHFPLGNYMIMEDDPIFSPNFVNRMKNLTSGLKDFGIVQLSGCWNIHCKPKDMIADLEVCKANWKRGISRCTSGFLITPHAASLFMKFLVESDFDLPKHADHWMNEAGWWSGENNIKGFWTDPYFMKQDKATFKGESYLRVGD